MDQTPPSDDLIQPFQLDTLGVRGRLVRLGPALEGILRPHQYPAIVAAMLAQTVTLSAVLAGGLKYDGVFTLQTQGDGPLGLMVADTTSTGDLRAYARYDEGRIAGAAHGRGAPVPRLLGAGRLAFTVDQGPDVERYQGLAELTGATIADCAQGYFRQSEQLETAIMLAATAMEDEGRARAGAMMIQRRPAAASEADTADENWRRAVILVSSLSSGEMLDHGLDPSRLLYRLFHEDGVRVYRARSLRNACRCSRDKVAATLGAFPQDQVLDMVRDGRITVTCEFCKTDHVFDEWALKRQSPV